MPIEIRELVIRATIDSPAAESDGESGRSSASRESRPTNDVVQECVRQVLRILEKNKER